MQTADIGWIDEREMNARVFVGKITGFTMYGLVLSCIMAYNVNLAMETKEFQDFLITVLCLLGIQMVGVYILNHSQHWMTALFGYTVIAATIGIMVGDFARQFSLQGLLSVIFATTLVVVPLSLVGIAYPAIFQKWGAYVLGSILALLCLYITRLVVMVLVALGHIPYPGDMTWMDVLGVLIFSASLVYSWSMAMRAWRYDMRTAIVCAANVHINIINLFESMANVGQGLVRLLRR